MGKMDCGCSGNFQLISTKVQGSLEIFKIPKFYTIVIKMNKLFYFQFTYLTQF